MEIKCSTCNKLLVPSEIKYFTADQRNAFCDAYCSNDWYAKKKKDQDE